MQKDVISHELTSITKAEKTVMNKQTLTFGSKVYISPQLLFHKTGCVALCRALDFLYDAPLRCATCA